MRRYYGHSPLHLVASLAALALIVWALSHVLDPFDSRARNLVVWLVGGAIVHDLVLLPLYSLADRAIPRGPAINYVRFPAVIAGTLLLVCFPLILDREPGNYRRATGMEPSGYLGAWLAITVGLFALSAAAYAVRRRARA